MTVARSLLDADTIDIDLRVDGYRDIGAGALEGIYLCSDREGTHLPVKAFSDNAILDAGLEENAWYRFSGMYPQVREHQVALQESRYHDQSYEPIEPPEQQDHPGPASDGTGPDIVQLGSSRGLVALDIEIMRTDPDVPYRMGDASTFEVAAVSVGELPAGGTVKDVESEVYLRESRDPDDELRVIREALQHVSRADATTLLTYNGGGFDLPRLADRLDILENAASQVPPLFADAVGHLYHADLMKSTELVTDAWGLEETAEEMGLGVEEVDWREYDHGLDPAEWRSEWSADDNPAESPDQPEIVGKDFPELMERYLKLREDGASRDRLDELEACMTAYADWDAAILPEMALDSAVEPYASPRLARLL